MIELKDGRKIYSCGNFSQHGWGASDYAQIIVAANTEQEALGLAIQYSNKPELKAENWSASAVEFEDAGSFIIDADYSST